MSDVLAAFLYGQLEVWQEIQSRRREIWTTYQKGLESWANQAGVPLPIIPEHCEQAYHMFYLLMPSLDARTHFIAHLKARGISAVFHYLPLHLSTYAQRWGGKQGDCPVTEGISDRLVRLPFFNSMSEEQQEIVVQSILSYRVS